MTRLTEDWIRDIPEKLADYDKELKRKTGYDLSVLGAVAGGIDGRILHRAAGRTRIAVIPITTGLGVIGSFSEAVAAIAEQMGFVASVTAASDVAGIFEAVQAGTEILMFADDQRFIALNLKKNRMTENTKATARGYATALEGAAGGLSNRRVAVLGCGRVGTEAMLFLRKRGAIPVAYGRDAERVSALRAEGWDTFQEIEELRQFDLVFDANPRGGWLSKEMLHPETWIAAPGVPLSLDDEARTLFQPRLIHDYLPIGVAAMIGSVL